MAPVSFPFLFHISELCSITNNDRPIRLHLVGWLEKEGEESGDQIKYIFLVNTINDPINRYMRINYRKLFWPPISRQRRFHLVLINGWPISSPGCIIAVSTSCHISHFPRAANKLMQITEFNREHLFNWEEIYFEVTQGRLPLAFQALYEITLNKFLGIFF